MKLASYNLENLFQRARVMNFDTRDEGAEILKMHAEINGTLAKEAYSAKDKKRIIELIKGLGIDKKDDGKYVVLRQNHGHLLVRGKKELQVVANGRGDWLGWVDLQVEEVNEVATRNTAQVIKDVNADLLGVIEAESRPALVRFSDYVLKSVKGKPFEHVMLIDGNDSRGIDVAIMTRKGYEIIDMRSHVDDADEKGKIFSRDCAEYMIATPAGNHILLLINHLKSKGFGSQAASNAKRERQAKRISEIYKGIRQNGEKLVAVIGDFNDVPDSKALVPIIDKTDLKDISQHAAFNDGGRPGTYGNCSKSNKIDYLLMSPELFEKVKEGGIFRKGAWGGSNGDLWEHYPEMKKSSDAASDHAAIWADLDI
jgi:endonuclease/exonuclease/phosphatase family metal-dependent hydrolase